MIDLFICLFAFVVAYGFYDIDKRVKNKENELKCEIKNLQTQINDINERLKEAEK